ncbi:uronate dehydrogenase-like [Glandiceps talaboti]
MLSFLQQCKDSGQLWCVAVSIGVGASIGYGVHKWWPKYDKCKEPVPYPIDDASMKRIGITGAAGTIGILLRQNLPSMGDFELVNYTLHDDEIEGSIGIDLSDSKAVSGKFQGLDCVVHLAADSNVRASWESVNKNNIIATYNVLQECVKSNVRKMIIASSNHVMNGNVINNFQNAESLNTTKIACVNMTEFDDPLPDSFYGVSKLTGEGLCKLYAAAHGIDIVSFRIGWVDSNDNPTRLNGTEGEAYLRSVYLSQRDCVQAFFKAITTKPAQKFINMNLTSANTKGIYCLDHLKEMIGFVPQDNSEQFWSEL